MLKVYLIEFFFNILCFPIPTLFRYFSLKLHVVIHYTYLIYYYALDIQQNNKQNSMCYLYIYLPNMLPNGIVTFPYI